MAKRLVSNEMKNNLTSVIILTSTANQDSKPDEKTIKRSEISASKMILSICLITFVKTI